MRDNFGVNVLPFVHVDRSPKTHYEYTFWFAVTLLGDLKHGCLRRKTFYIQYISGDARHVLLTRDSSGKFSEHYELGDCHLPEAIYVQLAKRLLKHRSTNFEFWADDEDAESSEAGIVYRDDFEYALTECLSFFEFFEDYEAKILQWRREDEADDEVDRDGQA